MKKFALNGEFSAADNLLFYNTDTDNVWEISPARLEIFRKDGNAGFFEVLHVLVDDTKDPHTITELGDITPGWRSSDPNIYLQIPLQPKEGIMVRQKENLFVTYSWFLAYGKKVNSSRKFVLYGKSTDTDNVIVLNTEPGKVWEVSPLKLEIEQNGYNRSVGYEVHKVSVDRSTDPDTVTNIVDVSHGWDPETPNLNLVFILKENEGLMIRQKPGVNAEYKWLLACGEKVDA